MSEDFHNHKRQRTESSRMQPTPPEPAHALNRAISRSDDRPAPPGVVEFLENPAHFRPTEDFANNTFVEDETVLTHAIKLQNDVAVETLLDCGADPNLPNRKGITPISVAAHKGNVAIMQLLVLRGARVNAVNVSGSTALIQAAHFGHIDAVGLLLRHSANADFANNKGTTALMRSCQEGHVEITKLLLGAPVDVNRKNHEGMNALMLASQRGHAEIVFLLIKAGAVMDEQTAQGSTALMLACKRGHEKCAEVLVSMGAEIFMRDRRNRTARDTAVKRNHTALICWLDTQVQIRRIQELKHKQRAALIAELRAAALSNTLSLNKAEAFVSDLFRAVKIMQYGPRRDKDCPAPPALLRPMTITSEQCDDAQQLIADFASCSPALSFISKSPSFVLHSMEKLVHCQHEQAVQSIPAFQSAFCAYFPPAKHVPNYADWQWPSLLLRCLGLPGGVFDMIMEYMPLPRVWQWSLVRVQRRCRLAPTQAMQDISILMDEILSDALVIDGRDQKFMLIKISRSPHLHAFLLESLGMPIALLESLCSWADVQSLLARSNAFEVVFKWPIARRMLSVAAELFKWYKQRTSATKWLSLVSPQALENAKLAEAGIPCGEVNTSHSQLGPEDLSEEGDDILAGTDAGGEEGSDVDIAVEPETETEFPLEVEVEGLLEDSDNEGDNMNA